MSNPNEEGSPEELTDEELEQVSGGQVLPPGCSEPPPKPPPSPPPPPPPDGGVGILKIDKI